MKARPILFSGAMVRALLDGSKTQTRRIAKPSRQYPFEFIGSGTRVDPDWNDPSCWGFMSEDGNAWLLRDDTTESYIHQIPCPYGQPGDRLWVRESGWISACKTAFIPAAGNGDAANVPPPGGYLSPDGARYKSCPSIHMPRWACRILLEITGVRVERLNDCSEADADAEGADMIGVETGQVTESSHPVEIGSHRAGYAELWDSINGAGAWETNPWVWVVEFRRVDE